MLRIERVGFGDPDALLLIERVQEEYVVRYGGRDETPLDPMMFELPAGSYSVAITAADAEDDTEPVLGPIDDLLMAEGNHHRLHDKLGAHLIEHEGAPGVHFALWAPNAQRVSVVGDFNDWDGRRHAMRRRGDAEACAPAAGRVPTAPTSRPPAITTPALGRSSPATSFRMVDLPQPLGPTSATKSPSAMPRVVWSSATVPAP